MAKDNMIKLSIKSDQEKFNSFLSCRDNHGDITQKFKLIKSKTSLYNEYNNIKKCISLYEKVKEITDPEIEKYKKAIETTGKKFLISKKMLTDFNKLDINELTSSTIVYNTIKTAEETAWSEAQFGSKSIVLNSITSNLSFGSIFFLVLILLGAYNKVQKKSRIEEIDHLTNAINRLNERINQKNNKK